MKPAALDPLARRVLRALYELAELDCPAHAGVLARAVNLTLAGAGTTRAEAPGAGSGRDAREYRAADLARILLVLDARGLASAERARLTLLGLATAARIAPLCIERAPGFPALRQQARRAAREQGAQRASHAGPKQAAN